MLKIFPCLLICFFLFACVSDSSEQAAEEDAKIAEQNKLTIDGAKNTTDQPRTVENAETVEALVISRTFDAENFVVSEGVQTQVYGLEWDFGAEDEFIKITEILLKESLPFDFSIVMTDPLEPCGDQMSVTFTYTATNDNVLLTSSDSFPFYDCKKCIQGLKLQFAEDTYTDKEITNKLLPSLAFRLEAAESLQIPEIVRLSPIHFTGDGFITDVSSLTDFIQYGLFTTYNEETKEAQHLMEFDFETEWQRAEQGKVVFRDIEVSPEGERTVLTEMDWTWEIKGPAKIALFDQNGDRYDVLFTSKIFKEDDNQIPHIQFEWKGKTFTSMAMWPC